MRAGRELLRMHQLVNEIAACERGAGIKIVSEQDLSRGRNVDGSHGLAVSVAEGHREHEPVQSLLARQAYASLGGLDARLLRHEGSCLGDPIALKASVGSGRAGWRRTNGGQRQREATGDQGGHTGETEGVPKAAGRVVVGIGASELSSWINPPACGACGSWADGALGER